MQSIACNANLTQLGRSLGLDWFIIGGKGAKHVANTVHAILGAVYLDDGLQSVRDVMHNLGLMTRKEMLDRQYEAEGLVILDEEDVPPQARCPPRKRKRSRDPEEQHVVKRFHGEQSPLVKEEIWDGNISQEMSRVESAPQAVSRQLTSDALDYLRDYCNTTSHSPSEEATIYYECGNEQEPGQAQEEK